MKRIRDVRFEEAGSVEKFLSQHSFYIFLNSIARQFHLKVTTKYDLHRYELIFSVTSI